MSDDFSAKRSLTIACRPSARLSVRLSVTLVDCDHIILWLEKKNLENIAQTISPTQLFVAKMGKCDLPTPREHWEILVRLEVG